MRNLTLIATTAFLALGSVALAAGSGGSGNNGGTAGGSSGNGGNSPSSHHCAKGEVWSDKDQKCLKAKGSLLPDEELFRQGRALAKEGNYDWALTVLAEVKDQNDPRVLTYEGFSNRKAGRFDLGMGLYNKALDINPDFVTAREYLGEGFVSVGKIDLAKAQLGEIGKRCGTDCEEYKDLAEAIASAN